MKAPRGLPGLDRLPGSLRHGAVAYGVLLISLLLTALAWYYVRDTVEKQSSVRFDETVMATQAAVDRRTDDYLDAMFGARGLILAKYIHVISAGLEPMIERTSLGLRLWRSKKS